MSMCLAFASIFDFLFVQDKVDEKARIHKISICKRSRRHPSEPDAVETNIQTYKSCHGKIIHGHWSTNDVFDPNFAQAQTRVA